MIALFLGAAIIIIDLTLHRFHWARKAFANAAGKIPRWIIWLVFLFSIGTAAHLASLFAMIALMVAIATFGFVMLAWYSAADKV